jgi:hypothetical protein
MGFLQRTNTVFYWLWYLLYFPWNTCDYLRLLHVLFVFVKEYPSSSLISYISIKHW